jgi:hypothetical protein
MPFDSKAQARWAFANKKKLAANGMDVEEWAKATNFKKLPDKKSGFKVLRTRRRGQP